MPIIAQAAQGLPVGEIVAFSVGIVGVLATVITILWRRGESQGSEVKVQLEARLAERTNASRTQALELQKLSTRNDDLVGRIEHAASEASELREENAVLRTRLEQYDAPPRVSFVAPIPIALPPPSAPARTQTQPSLRLPPIQEPKS